MMRSKILLASVPLVIASTFFVSVPALAECDPVDLGSLYERKAQLSSDLGDLAEYVEDADASEQLLKSAEKIDESLQAKYWEDCSTLTKDGSSVFDKEGDAADELVRAYEQLLDAGDEANTYDVVYILEKLKGIDFELADNMVDDAITASDACDPEVGGDCEKANEETIKARTHMLGDPADEIDQYKKAWEHAQEAVKKATP